MGTCPAYINEQLELNNSQHSRNTRGANLTILPRRYIREKEGGRTFSATTSRWWNHLPLKQRASESQILRRMLCINILNQVSLGIRFFTPFLDNLFSDRMT